MAGAFFFSRPMGRGFCFHLSHPILAQENFLCYTEAMKPITYQQFQEAVTSLTQQVPFELILRTEADGSTWGYVPYLMNDAMECFLALENCRVIGTILEDYPGPTQVEFADHTMGISVRQGDNVYTAWFTGIHGDLRLYQYHTIAHFWKEGQEQWRRLVYQIGTIYDKLKFSPQPVCNPEELRLARLMEFAPFRAYSPVSEPILSLYPETREGALTFAQMAEEAGDRSLARQIRLYSRFPNALLAIGLAKRLGKVKSIPVYHHIYQQLCAASQQYPARDYGPEQNRAMQAQRDKLTQSMLRQGFQGAYPLFQKEGLEVLATEEHPFTILETDDYRFRIRCMVSLYPDHAPKGVCPGFFSGKNYYSHIYTPKTE